MNYPDKVLLRLKKEDFVNAYYGSNTNCPIARAIKRKFKTNKVIVGGKTIDINQHINIYQIIECGESTSNKINKLIDNPTKGLNILLHKMKEV